MLNLQFNQGVLRIGQSLAGVQHVAGLRIARLVSHLCDGHRAAFARDLIGLQIDSLLDLMKFAQAIENVALHDIQLLIQIAPRPLQ